MKIILRLFLLFTTSVALSQGSIVELGELPQEVSETSGLLFFNDRVITHNDSGGEAILYEIDTVSREITRTVAINDAVNVDWEAISQDLSYIYIGDFGNNLGMRQDLTIYRISKSDYLDDDTATAEAILFSYIDQTDFSDTGNSDWDAEAFFVLGDELVILTKQWKSLGTVAYSIPKIPGSYSALRKGAVKNIGLVTDADYNPSNETLFILGYSSILLPFARTYTTTVTTIFSDTFSTVSIDIGLAQVEGVANDGAGNYLVSSELFMRQSPNIVSLSRLFKLNLIAEEEPEQEEPGEGEEPNPNPPHNENKEELLIFKELSTGTIRYTINSESAINGTRIYDVNGKAVWEQFNTDIEREGVVIQTIPTSIYYFVVYFDNAVRSKAFAVY
jgi:hypothetical protein